MALDEKSKSVLMDLADGLASLAKGTAPKHLPRCDDPTLNRVIDNFNTTVDSLSAQATQTSESRVSLDALFTQSADAIMTLAPPEWKFTSCNPAALKLFKVSSPEEFVKLGPWNLSPERQPDGGLSSVQAPEAIMQAMKTGSHFFEWDHQTLAGETINCTVLLSRVDVNKESYLQATVRDVTRKKQIESDFKSIFSDSPLGIIRLDSCFCYTSVNPAYEKFTGYSEQELKAISMLDLTHPEDKERTLEKIQAFPKSGGKLLKQFEKRYIHKSGKTIWGRLTSQALPDAKGNLSYLTIIEDITEQKANEVQTTAILDTMADGLVMQDKDGAIESFNPAALTILGLTEDQLRGRTSRDPSWKAIKEDGSPFPGEEHPAMIALETGLPIKGVMMGLVLPDQTERWIKINAIPFEGTTGRRLACTFSDVTELFNAQSEIRFMLDALKIGVWKFNPVTQDLYWDKSMYDVFELEEKDFTGHYQAWESTLTPESKGKAVEELGQALRGEKEFNTVFEIETKTRGRRFISGHATVIRDSDKKPIMMYGLNTDVTEQLKIKNELELERTKSLRNAKLASLGEMSAGIAHEINNPLAIIAGSVGLLERLASDPQKLTAKVEMIKKSCERISRIVTGLKKFSRSSEKSNFETHVLADIAKEALFLTESNSKRNNTPVTFECQTEAQVVCDDVEIEQVLVNLVNNAIDAVKPNSEKWVKIELTERDTFVVIKVTDSGKGIPETIQNKLFEPFFTTKRVGEGTGLGLSIAKGIIDEHKGMISLLPDCPNTCFEILIPKA